MGNQYFVTISPHIQPRKDRTLHRYDILESSCGSRCQIFFRILSGTFGALLLLDLHFRVAGRSYDKCQDIYAHT